MEQTAERQSAKCQLKDAARNSEPGNNAPERGKTATSRNAEKVYFPIEEGKAQLISLFRELAASTANINTRKDAEKFISAFVLFDNGRKLTAADINAELVGSFRDFLANRGHTASYIAKRMQNFRSLYRRLAKEGRVDAAPEGSFDIVDSSHPSGNPAARKHVNGGSVVEALTRLAHMRINDTRLASSRDKLLEAILSAGNGFDNGDGDFAADAELLLRSCGISVEGFSRSLPAELWIRAARESGISATDIAAACGTIPEGYAENAVAGPLQPNVSEAPVLRLRNIILGKSPQWYALRLRTGCDAETVRRLLAGEPGLAGVKPYAPVEHLVVRRGKRLKSTIVERIRRVMFVEAEQSVIADVAKTIAQAATVYRQSRAADAPFARIPRREMDNFRILIDGAEDVEIADTASLAALPEGTEVEVTDGPFAGYRGRIHPRGSRHLLTVALTSDFGLLVTAAIPAPYLRVVAKH